MPFSPRVLRISMRRAVLAALLWPVGTAPLRAQSASPAVIVGVVIDSATGMGIAGAEVGLHGTDIRILTDERGRFRFGAPWSAVPTLRVRRLGFSPRIVAVSGGGDD